MATAYVEIPLHGQKAAGRVALIDIDDYESVIEHRWCVWERQKPGHHREGPYAVTNLKSRGQLKMHKMITGLPETDHRNHQTLDNRRSNLRDGTAEKNRMNGTSRAISTSRFLGVYRDNSRGKWMARITVNKKLISLGRFDDEEAAARARDDAARELFGEYASLNFPEE